MCERTIKRRIVSRVLVARALALGSCSSRTMVWPRGAPKQPTEPPPAAMVAAKKRPRVVEPPQWVKAGVPQPPPPPVRERSTVAKVDLGCEPKSSGSRDAKSSGSRDAKAAEVESEDEQVAYVQGVGVALPCTPPETIAAGPDPTFAARQPPDYVEPATDDTEHAEKVIAAHKQLHKEVSGDRVSRGGWQSKAQVLVDLVCNGFNDEALIIARHYGSRMDAEQVAEVLRRSA